MDLLENEMKLSEKELKYCNIVMTNSTGISDSDIARKMGVTPAAINYMKKSLARKLMLVS
jgi:DNA-binding CsgD family transcriptional regulator